MKVREKQQSWMEERGQALAEFALVAPVLFLLIVGIIDLGRVVFVYSMSLNALREATRNAELLGYQESSTGLPNYLNCDKITADASDLLFTAPDEVTVEYHFISETDGSVTGTKDCDDPPADTQLHNGDILAIEIVVTLDLLMPFADEILGGDEQLTFQMDAQRTIVKSIVLNPGDPNDIDFDGLKDDWEIANFGSIEAYTGLDDPDGDGLNNGAEENNLTNPNDPDSDDDNLNDRQEVYIHKTDPNDKDTDDDNLEDGDEITRGTDPLNPDTDGDTLLDGNEVFGLNPHGFVSDPLKKDTDEDGLTDDREIAAGTNPGFPDTDTDGLWDTEELLSTLTDPNDQDTDDDGLTDFEEVRTTGTNPNDADTDDDGLSDGEEINTYMTNPKLADHDGDGLSDGEEVNGINLNNYTSNPKSIDSDSDGLTDKEEVTAEYGYYSDPMLTNTDGDCIVRDYDEVVTYAGHPDGPFDPNDFNTSCPTTGGTQIIDTDGDGLPDPWEELYFGDIGLYDGDDDPDGDGVPNYLEEIRGTDPMDPDADGDGISDEDEIYGYQTDPLNPDTDGDGLQDGEEINGTPPTNAKVVDTDGDGLTDFQEVKQYGTNPTKIDTDADGLSDGDEINVYGTNPLDLDTDDDGLTDGQEINLGTDPLDADSDDDGLNDGDEVNTHGTEPANPDTDGDGLNDGAEVNTHGTLPTDTDTDNDGLNDGPEVNTHGTDPLVIDTDNDGLSDAEEVNNQNTNPILPDTDGDGLTDGSEVNVHLTNPIVADTDGDGLSDGEEVNGPMGYQPSNPHDVNTDHDHEDKNGDGTRNDPDPFCPAGGLSDGEEVTTYQTDPSKVDTDGDGLTDCEEIFDNDPDTEPTVAISIFFDGPSSGDQTITEPIRANDTVNMVFTVKLSTAVPAGSLFTVDFTTVDFTAVAGQDYTASRGRLRFNPGEQTKTITIVVNGDQGSGAVEGTETFSISLYNASGGRIDDATATGTILDEDS